MSIAGNILWFDNCTFHMNAAPSGTALVNVGSIDLPSSFLAFSSNELMCPEGQFVDYVDLLDDDGSNTTEAVGRVGVAASQTRFPREQMAGHLVHGRFLGDLKDAEVPSIRVHSTPARPPS